MNMPNVQELLSQKGIKLKNYGYGQHTSTCPECSESRKAANKRSQCLSIKIDEDGACWTCHHCGWTDAGFHKTEQDGWQRKTKVSYERPKEIPLANDLPDPIIDWFASRGISKETLKEARINEAEAWFPKFQNTKRCVAFEYYRDGEIVSRKYRTISEKAFTQDAGCEQIFYGHDDVLQFFRKKTEDAKNERLIIAEGEMDRLALCDVGFWNSVSVPSGAKNLDFLSYSDDLFLHEDTGDFRDIVIAGDLDEDGKQMMEELARRLGKEHCYRVRWPKAADGTQCKDANEVLMLCGREALQEAINSAEGWPIDDIHVVSDYLTEVVKLWKGEVEKPVSTGYPNLDKHWQVKAGDMTVVTGIPNTGKSEFVDSLILNLAQLHGWKTGICSFENPPAEHIAKLIEKRSGAPFFNDVMGHPKISEKELRTASEWLEDHIFFIRSDDPDARPPTIEWIIEKAMLQVRRHGIRALVIDPYNEISSNRPSNMTETEYISYLLSCVKRFAQTYGVHCIIVAHPKKMESFDGVVHPPALYDISGSAHWANKADNGLTVHRSLQDSGAPVEVHVTKVRWKHVGKRGGVAEFSWTPWNGRFSPRATPVSV